MIFDLPPVLVKKPSARKACEQPVGIAFRRCRSASRCLNWRTWSTPCLASGRCTTFADAERSGCLFRTLFPAVWQLPLIRQFRGAYTLLEFG